jgi:hypothetical protein
MSNQVRSAALKIWNESALGIYQFAWKSATGSRCELAWYEGLDAPRFSFWISGQQRMSPPVAVRNPERFGWRTPRRVADFKVFVQAFADACEQESGGTS